MLIDDCPKSAAKCLECALGAMTVNNKNSQSYCINCVAGQYGLKVNAYSVVLRKQLIDENQNVEVIQGMSSGKLFQEANFSPKEWTIVVNQKLNVPAGVGVYQGEATGTLKTAHAIWTLTVQSTSITESASASCPVSQIDNDINVATLKTDLIKSDSESESAGAVNVIIESASDVVFTNDADLKICELTISASSITSAVRGAETTIVIVTADDITFKDNMDIVIDGITIDSDKIDAVNEVSHADEFKIYIEAAEGTTFVNNVDLIVGSTTIQKSTIGDVVHVSSFNTCHNCGKGKYSVAEANVKIEACLDCGIGFFAKDNGATFCAPCLPGFYDAGDSNRDECKSCPKGYYQDKSGKDATQCYEW